MPEAGDWVEANTTIKSSLSDFLFDNGISAGTRGVVVDRSGRYVEVQFGSGLNSTTARVPTSNVRVTRRRGGWENFHRRERRMTIVRCTLALFLLLPIIQFVAIYVWNYRSFDGIAPTFAQAAIESLGDWIATAIQHPLQSLVYLAFLAALSRIAFRH